MPARTKAHLEIALVILIWGFASVVIKSTLADVPPLYFLTYRFFISALVGIFFYKTIRPLFHLKKKLLLLFFVYSFATTVFGLGLLFIGLEKTSVVNLSLIQSVQPILLILLAHYIFKEHLTKKAKIGAALALFGAIITIIQPLFLGFDNTFLGNSLIAVFMAFDVLGILILKKLMRSKVSPLALTNFSFIVGFITFAIMLLAIDTPITIIKNISSYSLKDHLAVFYMAIASGTVAYAIRARAQKSLTVSALSIYGYLGTVVTTTLAIILLHEQLSPMFLVGASIIVVGVFLVEHKSKRV